MAGSSVTQRVSEDQTARSIDWEEECYREGCGCAYARAQAKHRLSALDDELLGDKPTGWTVLGFRERTLVTRFGDVVVRRRMYRDHAGRTRYRACFIFWGSKSDESSEGLDPRSRVLGATEHRYNASVNLLARVLDTVSQRWEGGRSASCCPEPHN